jgi:hypothetical protein
VFAGFFLDPSSKDMYMMLTLAEACFDGGYQLMVTFRLPNWRAALMSRPM